MVWREIRKLPRPIWVLFWATLINRVGTMAFPFLTLFLIQSKHWSVPRASLALTLYGLGSVISAPLAGVLSDRFGPARMIRWMLFASAAVMLCIPWIDAPFLLLPLSLLFGLFGEGVRPASMALISSVPGEQRTIAFAFIRWAVNAGMSIGPVVGGLLVSISFPALFIIDALTSLGACAAMWIGFPGNGPVAIASGPRKLSNLLGVDAFADRTFTYFMLAILPVSVVFFQHVSIYPIFLVEDLHFSPSFFGFVFTINTALILVLELPLSTRIANWPFARALSLGAFLFSAGFGVLAFCDTKVQVMASVGVWTFGEMLLFPAGASYVAWLSPPEKRGSYMGAYAMLFGLGFLIAPPVGAFLREEFGTTALWLIMAAIGFCSTLMLLRLAGRSSETRVAVTIDA